MKILLATGIYPPDIGGPATYTQTMARELSARGHGVEVICYTDDDTSGELRDDEKFSVTRISRKQPTWKRYLAYALAVMRLAKNADLVYLQGPVSEGFPGTIGAMLAGKPTVMKIVGDYAWEIYMQKGSPEKKELLDEFVTHPHAEVRWLERIERWTAKRAKQIIVPSKYLERIVERWGIEADLIRVIYNQASYKIPLATQPLNGNDPIHPSEEDQARLRKRLRLHLPDNRPSRIVLTAVRCVPWKSCDFIIGLMSDLPTDIHFVIAGDGPSREEWKSLALKNGVSDRVHFLGALRVESMRDCYSAADLFILPSGYEGFPNVIPEAVSNGLCCFVSDRGGNPETQDLYGEDRITILPYLNSQAWLDALKGTWPPRRAGQISEKLFGMVEKTVEVLKDAISV